MRQLTGDELHFEIRAALMQLSYATLRDLGDEARKQVALDTAADVVKAWLEEVANRPAGSRDAVSDNFAPDGGPALAEQPANAETDRRDRISRRVELALNAEVRQTGGSFVSALVLDLSTHGFRIQTHLWPNEGSDLWLRLPGLETRPSRVAWVRGPVIGCAFQEPLHEAVLDLIVSKGRRG